MNFHSVGALGTGLLRDGWVIMAVLGIIAAPVHAGSSYTSTTINSSSLWQNSAIWSGGLPGGFPGNGSESPLGSDSATVTFGSSSSAVLSLNAPVTLNSLTIGAGSGSNKPQITSTSGIQTLNLTSLTQTAGFQQLDFVNVRVQDVNDGNPFQLLVQSQPSRLLDLGGGFSGSDGLIAGGNGSFIIRGYQMANDKNLTIVPTSNGNVLTSVIAFDTTAGNINHRIDTLIQDQTGNTNGVTFGVSNGTNKVVVDVAHVSIGANGDTLSVGGMSDEFGNPLVTVNINGIADFSAASSAEIDTFSQGKGIVNINAGVKASASNNFVTLVGTGVLNIRNIDITNSSGGAWTGTTQIGSDFSFMKVSIDAPTRLGAGLVNLVHGSTLGLNYDVFASSGKYPGNGNTINSASTDRGYGFEFETAQSGFFDPLLGTGSAFQVRTYTHLAGNLQNATFGASGNIRFKRDSVLGDTSGPLPTRAQVLADTGGSLIWKAVTGNGQTIADIGDDGSGIFRGVAFSPLLYSKSESLATAIVPGASSTQADFTYGFHGSLSAIAGQPLEIMTTWDTAISAYTMPDNTAQKAIFNSSTGIANIRGPGELSVYSSTAGTVNVINRIGETNTDSQGLNTQNITGLSLAGTGAIASGQTWNAFDVLVHFDVNDSISNGGTLNIDKGATLVFFQRNTPSSGGFHISKDGALVMNGALNTSSSVRSAWVADPGSLLFLGNAASITLSDPVFNASVPNMDVVLRSASGNSLIFSATAGGMQLGNGRRLTTSSDANATLNNVRTSTAADNDLVIKTNVAGSTVLMTAASSRTLDVNVNVSLSGSDLQIGDTAQFVTTTTSSVARISASQNGRVRLDGAGTGPAPLVTIRNLTIVNGGLSVGDSTNDKLLVSGNLLQNAAVTGNSQNTSLDNGEVQVAGNIVINSSGVNPSNTAAAQFKIEADVSTAAAVGAGSFESRLIGGTLALGADGIRIHDFGMASIDINPASAAGVTLNQKITFATTGSNFNGGATGSNLRITTAGSFSTAPVILNDVQLNAGSVMQVDEVTTSTIRANLTLRGDATMTDGSGTSNDPVDLIGVKSSANGSVRTLKIGDGVNTATYKLQGLSTADITLDVRANSTLQDLLASGGDIQGHAIVRSSGVLNIDGGSETLNNLANFGSVTMTNGGSLKVAGTLSGTGTITGNTTLLANASFNPGASPGVLTLNGNLTLDSNSILNFELADPTIPGPPANFSDRINITGLLNISAGQIHLNFLNLPGLQAGLYTLFNYGTLSGNVASSFLLSETLTGLNHFEYSLLNDTANHRIVLSVIPEPSSIFALAAGLIGLAMIRRRCR